MKITLEPVGIEMTDSLAVFMEKKFTTLAKLVKHFEGMGEVEMRVTLSRSTKRQKKGDVYRVSADLRLPGKVLRADETGDDLRQVASMTKDVLKMEIEKYKEKKMNGGKRVASRK